MPAEEFARHDAVVISTAHRDFRDLTPFAQARLVVDTRNLIPADTLPPETLGPGLPVSVGGFAAWAQ